MVSESLSLSHQRYKIIKHLGSGGFTETYIAEDRNLPNHPLCVIKKLKPRSNEPETLEAARRLFETEAKVLSQLGTHDQITRTSVKLRRSGRRGV